MKSNEKDNDNVCYKQPKNIEDRVAIANDFTQALQISCALRHRRNVQRRE